MTFEFHPEARLELLEAIQFYESRRVGLGTAFSFEVEATIERVRESPDRWRLLEDDVRICRTHTFPYANLYSVESGSILILAVMHLHREPGYWRERQSPKASG